MITSPQRCPVWKQILLAAFTGLLFGLISGYAGALINHHNEGTFGASYRQYQYEWFIIPSVPGDFITWQAAGAHDWLLDEGWDYRLPVTLWNGVFWLLFAVAVTTLKAWSRQYLDKSRRLGERGSPR